MLAVFSSGALKSQTDSLSQGDDGLAYLIRNAVSSNSKLEELDYRRKIELIKKEQVNKQPMPMFEAMIDYIPLNFMDKPEYSGYLSQRIMLGKLGAMEKMSTVNADAQSIAKEQLKTELSRGVKRNYFELYYYEKLLGFNSEFKNILKDIVRTLELNYASGMGSQNQILKMNNELVMLEFENTGLESSRKVYVNNLRVLSNLNLPDDYRTKNVDYIFTPGLKLDTLELARIMISNNPEFKMIDNMVEKAAVEKNIAELERIPDITLRGGYKYMAKEPMSYITFSIGVDLPFMPWNSKRVDAMVGEKSLMELQANSLRTSTLQYMKNELNSMVIMINSMRDKISFLKDVVIPQSELTFKSTLASYSSGSGEFMNLLDSYRNLRQNYLMLAGEESELLKQYGELEFLLGRQITKIK